MVRIIKLCFSGVVALIMVLLALANRHDIPLYLDPFRPYEPGAPVADVNLATLIFCVFILGLIIGSVMMWFMQGDYRRQLKRNNRQHPAS
jgi:uncharacterized integral membrane protein